MRPRTGVGNEANSHLVVRAVGCGLCRQRLQAEREKSDRQGIGCGGQSGDHAKQTGRSEQCAAAAAGSSRAENRGGPGRDQVRSGGEQHAGTTGVPRHRVGYALQHVAASGGQRQHFAQPERRDRIRRARNDSSDVWLRIQGGRNAYLHSAARSADPHFSGELSDRTTRGEIQFARDLRLGFG